MSGDAPQIEVRTRFERFPASLKGAFVMRGADGNPHGIRLMSAGISRLPVGETRTFPIEDRSMDVAPNRDLFVPFEVGIGDLEPGWYEIRSAVSVDAARPQEFASRPFVMPWPRNDVRRGTIRVGKELRVGKATFRIERVELSADASTVFWHGEGEADAIVVVEGSPLEMIPREALARLPAPRPSPERRTVSYPVPRTARSVAVAVRLRSGDGSDPLLVTPA
jgi:hypothetical protein